MNNTSFLNLIDAIGSNKESAWNRIVDTPDSSDDQKYHILSPLIKTFVDFADEPVVFIPAQPEDSEIEQQTPPHRNATFRHPQMENDRLAYIDLINNDDNDLKGLIKTILPEGFNPLAIKKVTILAVSNKAVDEWNDIIAALNPNPESTYESKDWFAEVVFIISKYVVYFINIPHV